MFLVFPVDKKTRLNGVYQQLFSQKKPIGLITASASGKKGHEELKLIK